MRLNALRARPKRRGTPKDNGERSHVAANILDRDFRATRPNQKWLADFTYIWTAEGWLYVAGVLDLFSRRIVGWSMKAERDASLVMDALMMAVWRRGKTNALLHHSDQGSQYTSYQRPRMLTHGAFEDPKFIKCSQWLDKFRTEYQKVIVNDLWYQSSSSDCWPTTASRAP